MGVSSNGCVIDHIRMNFKSNEKLHHSTLSSTSYINTYLQDEDAVTSRRDVAVVSKVIVILLILQQSVHCKENTLHIKKPNFKEHTMLQMGSCGVLRVKVQDNIMWLVNTDAI